MRQGVEGSTPPAAPSARTGKVGPDGTAAALPVAMPERARRLLSASAVGLVATAVDVAVLALLYQLGIVIGVAAFTASIAGAVVGFVANKYWTFRDPQPVSLRQLSTYAAVTLFTALFTAAVMHLACDRGHAPYLLAKLVSASLVFACWTYPAQRRLVFV